MYFSSNQNSTSMPYYKFNVIQAWEVVDDDFLSIKTGALDGSRGVFWFIKFGVENLKTQEYYLRLMLTKSIRQTTFGLSKYYHSLITICCKYVFLHTCGLIWAVFWIMLSLSCKVLWDLSLLTLPLKKSCTNFSSVNIRWPTVCFKTSI